MGDVAGCHCRVLWLGGGDGETTLRWHQTAIESLLVPLLGAIAGIVMCYGLLWLW